MAELYRLRYDGLTNALGAAITTTGQTNITFSTALQTMGTNIPSLTTDQYIALTIDNEIVHLTAYTGGGTTGTISRAQENTTAATHSNAAVVFHSPTVYDFNNLSATPATVDRFTATASQTAFVASQTLTASVQVYRNGLLQRLTTDYTVSGSTVTLTSGASVGDAITVIYGTGSGTNPTAQAYIAVDPTKYQPETTVGTWSPSSTASSEIYLVSSGAQNDEAVWWVPLGPGTYDFKMTYFSSSNRGIATIAVDDGAGTYTTLTTIDTYSAGNVDLTMTTVTGLTVPTNVLRRRVRIKMATKNASSSSYFLTVHGFSFHRTDTAIAPVAGVIKDRRWFKGSPPHAQDDEFNDSFLDTPWTRVDAATTGVIARATWTENADSLSLVLDGTATQDATGGEMHGLVKPYALAVGESITCHSMQAGLDYNYHFAGLVVADGTTYGSGNQVFYPRWSYINLQDGLWTGWNTRASFTDHGDGGFVHALYTRIKRTATTTWSFDVSANGFDWVVINTRTLSMTPTHVGFAGGQWGGTGKQNYSFEHFRVLTT